jgi:diguanylate cyclase (GGDEF)-like protein
LGLWFDFYSISVEFYSGIYALNGLFALFKKIKDNLENLFPPEEFRIYESEARNMLSRGFKFLKFSDILENLFNDLDLPNRRLRYLRMGLGAIFLYNLFCISDYLMIRDVYKTAWAIRLIVVTPILLTVVFFMYFPGFQKIRLRRLIEYVIGFLLMLTSASHMLISGLISPPGLHYFQSGIFVVVILGNIVFRMRFWFALTFSVIIQILFSISISYVFFLNYETVFNSSLLLLCVIILTLIGNYQMDMEIRKGFLLTLLLHIDSIRMEESNRELKHLSLSDPLTGLANRRYFDSAYEQEWRAALRRKYGLSLIFMDIDFFKLYNDNYGHQAGDECLRQIAGVLKKFAQRPHDVCARYGGEEFVIFLPQISLSNAIELAERIRISIKNLAIPHEFSRIDKYVTVSLGVAEVIPSLAINETNYLIEQADKALYIAKNNGRNRVCTHLDSN